MCKYCEGKSPLTDKVYEDGSKFDDSQSTRIEYIGKVPVIVAEVKEKHFQWPFCRLLSEEQKKFLARKWAVHIKYCPICGEKLYDQFNITDRWPKDAKREKVITLGQQIRAIPHGEALMVVANGEIIYSGLRTDISHEDVARYYDNDILKTEIENDYFLITVKGN